MTLNERPELNYSGIPDLTEVAKFCVQKFISEMQGDYLRDSLVIKLGIDEMKIVKGWYMGRLTIGNKITHWWFCKHNDVIAMSDRPPVAESTFKITAIWPIGGTKEYPPINI